MNWHAATTASQQGSVRMSGSPIPTTGRTGQGGSSHSARTPGDSPLSAIMRVIAGYPLHGMVRNYDEADKALRSVGPPLQVHSRSEMKALLTCVAAAVLMECGKAGDPLNQRVGANAAAAEDTTYEARLARWIRDSIVIDSLGQPIPIDGLVAALLAWRANPDVPQLHEATFCEVFKLAKVHGMLPASVAERRAFDRAGFSAEDRARVHRTPALVPGRCDVRGLPERFR